jgi:hypothetical protein
MWGSGIIVRYSNSVLTIFHCRRLQHLSSTSTCPRRPIPIPTQSYSFGQLLYTLLRPIYLNYSCYQLPTSARAQSTSSWLLFNCALSVLLFGACGHPPQLVVELQGYLRLSPALTLQISSLKDRIRTPPPDRVTRQRWEGHSKDRSWAVLDLD